MFMKWLMMTNLLFSLILLKIKSPLKSNLMILIQLILLTLMLNMINKTSWISYMIFILYISGLMINFLYISMIAFNKIKINKINYKFLIIKLILMMIFMNYMNSKLIMENMNYENMYMFEDNFYLMNMFMIPNNLIIYFILMMKLTMVCKCCVTWNRCSIAINFSQAAQYKIWPSLCKCSFGNSETYFVALQVLDDRTFGIIGHKYRTYIDNSLSLMIGIILMLFCTSEKSLMNKSY